MRRFRNKWGSVVVAPVQGNDGRGPYAPVEYVGCRCWLPRGTEGGCCRPSFSFPADAWSSAIDPCSSAAASSFLQVHSLRPLEF